jgi:ABC-type ATPase involved in cell division
MQPTLLDPRLLSTPAVLENVHHAMRCAGLRVGEYAREMAAALAWLVAARDKEWRACTRGERRVLGAVVRRVRY